MPQHLVWIDTETTGLEENCKVLEVACVVTNLQGEELAVMSETVRPKQHDLEEFLCRSEDDWALKNHKRTGLVSDVLAHGRPLQNVLDLLNLTIDIWGPGVDNGEFIEPIWAGSGVDFDQRVLRDQGWNWDRLRFSHRTFEMQTLRKFFEFHRPDLGLHVRNEVPHRALPDLRQQIEMYKAMAAVTGRI